MERKGNGVDVYARRLGWTPSDGLPEIVSGELVILDPEGAGDVGLHVVDGHRVDPDSLVAVQWRELRPARGMAPTPLRPPSSSPRQAPPRAGP